MNYYYFCYYRPRTAEGVASDEYRFVICESQAWAVGWDGKLWPSQGLSQFELPWSTVLSGVGAGVLSLYT